MSFSFSIRNNGNNQTWKPVFSVIMKCYKSVYLWYLFTAGITNNCVVDSNFDLLQKFCGYNHKMKLQVGMYSLFDSMSMSCSTFSFHFLIFRDLLTVSLRNFSMNVYFCARKIFWGWLIFESKFTFVDIIESFHTRIFFLHCRCNVRSFEIIVNLVEEIVPRTSTPYAARRESTGKSIVFFFICS